jgi:hypothetical protein
MKRRITMVAGTHLTVLDRRMINAALDAGGKRSTRDAAAKRASRSP